MPNTRQQQIAKLLLNWYDMNRRDLPWRRNRDPYRVWVSEIMLQQTRVEAVIPYYERWMERFPTPASLAAADEEAVLRQWQGLGYYSRARNLLQGVREAVAIYGGVPMTREAVAGLAGVGDYTTGAILSIAYDQKEPALDGNALRVFSRLAFITLDIGTAAAKKMIREVALDVMDEQRPGDFNQALMDLGSAICVPRAPRCDVCPLREVCQAHAEGRAGELPVKRKKTPPRDLWLAAGVVAGENGCYLLRRRPDKGLLAGMWEFPAVEALPEEGQPERLQRFLGEEAGLNVAVEDHFWEMIHTFSHRRWHLNFYHCRLLTGASLPAGWAWRSICDGEDVLFAGPHGQVAALLQELPVKMD